MFVSDEGNLIVSVIVPARNEETCLASCLESLVTQTGIDFEIVVVDDDSTDRTAEIARTFVTTECVGTHLQDSHPARFSPDGTETRPILMVISAPPLPDGWTGKNNAMAAGAKIAKGKWLLFTDADTVHRPGSMARAVAEAEQHGAALLSYSPEQEVRTFWEKAVMPVIFAELAATYPPKRVNDPSSPIAAANGQYLLISREAYDAVGGHAKIADNLLEDVAMARLVKSSGRRIFFRYGGDAVRTRMYRSWAQMKEGWTKNLALVFPMPIWTAVWNLMLFYLLFAIPAGIALALAGFVPGYYGRLAWPQLVYILDAITGLVVVAAMIFSKLGKANFKTSRVIAVIGLPIFGYLLLRSEYSLHRRSLNWKGRAYRYRAADIEGFRNTNSAIDAQQLYNVWTRIVPGSWLKRKT